MNSLGSRFIILLLLVLQGFAPLVHAHVHVNNNFSISGVVHINGLSVDNVELNMATIDSVGRQHLAIEIGVAIQKNQSLDGSVDLHEFYIDTAHCCYFSLLLDSSPGFSLATKIEPFRSHFLFPSHPRAPPL